MRRVLGSVALFGLFGLAACPSSPPRRPDAAPQASIAEPFEVGEWMYDGRLAAGWQESGSAARELGPNGPAKIRFQSTSDWSLARPGLTGQHGGIFFRVKEPAGEGEFLEVRLGSAGGGAFPAVKVKPDHRTELGDGWAQILIPVSELDPSGASFDRVVFKPFRPLGDEWVLIDRIGLTKSTGAVAAATPTGPGRPASVRVSCDAPPTPISPYIYGIAFGNKEWPALRPAARRWGGNPTTRYNWQNHHSNGANDWFFENRGPGAYTDFFAENIPHGVMSAMTVPMIGWVAKDNSSYGFPVSKFGRQQKTDPWRSDAGNGVSPSGEKITPGPPTQTSVAGPPAFMGQWVAAIRASETAAGKRNVYEYILDNEPMLWNTTHRDVHPDPVGYDELLDRTIQYASAIRAADPQALIAGPAEWGWTNYFYSAKDVAPPGLHTDRLAHGNTPLVEWYLSKVCEKERKTGTRILDVFDLHFYPQGNNVFGGGQGGTDPNTQRLRLRSTRSLWDPKYIDESWINEPVRLLPRMREWVDKNCPGKGISIGEWNFGGEKDITGALATAEALGRFAQFGVTSAFYWTAPDAGTPTSVAFLAYRNFDGRGGHFLDSYVRTSAPDGLSVFASRDSQDGKHLVVVAVNLSPENALASQFDVSSCGTLSSQRTYAYAGSSAGLAASDAPAGGAGRTTFEASLPPWSITVVDVHLQ